MDDEWVVVAEHVMQAAWVPIDSGGMDLIYYESVLNEQGIETGFLPYRPGENPGFTRSVEQPVQLLVKAIDAARARGVIDELQRAE
jgi:hypothetical protein